MFTVSCKMANQVMFSHHFIVPSESPGSASRHRTRGPGGSSPELKRVSPPDVLGQGFLAGVEFVAEGAFVLLLLEGRVAGVLLLVHGQVGLGGVALKTDVTLEWFLSRVHSGVTLVLPYKVQGISGHVVSVLVQDFFFDTLQTKQEVKQDT